MHCQLVMQVNLIGSKIRTIDQISSRINLSSIGLFGLNFLVIDGIQSQINV